MSLPTSGIAVSGRRGAIDPTDEATILTVDVLGSTVEITIEPVDDTLKGCVKVRLTKWQLQQLLSSLS